MQIKKTMKAWICPKSGIENATIKDVEIPEPGDYDILVKVLATGLNPVDWKRCEWEWGIFKFPCHFGLDACGLVYKLGKKVDQNLFIPNKTVVYYHGNLFLSNEYGSFAEYHVQDSRYLTIVPQELINQNKQDPYKLYCDLASLPTAAFTAHSLVCNKLKFPIFKEDKMRANFQKRRSVMVAGGAGGVGLFALQLLNMWRNTFPEDQKKSINILTTCSKSSFDYVKSLGATHPIDYNTDNVDQKIKEITNGKGVDAWIDLVGEKTVQQGLQNLSFGGELALIVDNTNYEDKLFSKAISIHNVALGWAYDSGDDDKKLEIYEMTKFWLELYQRNQVKTMVNIINFEQIKDFLIQMKDGHTKGKIVAKLV